jgi:polyhydroxyalkanoate synthase
MTAARLELLQRTRVEQAIDRTRVGQFGKEILKATTPSGRSLALVRKYRDDVERRGAVLLVHGFAQNRYSWHLSTRSFVNFLADAGLDVYNLELTGHGRSREYGTGTADSFTDYVEDCASVIRAVGPWAAVDKLFVVGHSLGGAVLYAAAPRVPEHLAGIVTIAGMFRWGSNPVTRRLAEFAQGIQKLNPVAGALGRMGFRTRRFGEAIARWWEHADELSASFPMAGWVPGSTEPHVLQERVVRGFDWTGLSILLTMLRWASTQSFDGDQGEDYAEAFAKLKTPLLVIAGDRDRLLPPEDARPAYDLSESPDRTWKLFSDRDEEVHWGHLDIVLGKDAPRFVWPYVRDWILDRCPEPQ